MAGTTVAILSPGEMGSGIACLLKAHQFRVITSISGRSSYTYNRAIASKIEFVSSDIDLINQADFILSIVPPSEALPTARRVGYAYTYAARGNKSPLYYFDLNAVSPNLAEKVQDVFSKPTAGANNVVRFIDGAILGGVPEFIQGPGGVGGVWRKPRVVVSGKEKLVGDSGRLLEEVLGLRWVGDRVGQASGLKMCFASLTKGLTGLAVQSFTTASNLSLLPALKEELAIFYPPLLTFLESAVPNVPPKAYRFVREMEEIADTHAEAGFSRAVFSGIADIYRGVAQDEVLGKERSGERNKGQTVDDFADTYGEGMRRREEVNRNGNNGGVQDGVELEKKWMGRAVERMAID